MLKVLLFDRLFMALFTLLLMTLCTWAFGIFAYPFGLLILISTLLARWIHLYGMHNDHANPPKFR